MSYVIIMENKSDCILLGGKSPKIKKPFSSKNALQIYKNKNESILSYRCNFISSG